ncbi:MAG TPA: hypothetical protein VN578_11530 [Candidatus Binatia bacterium]|nr:hypothetical protein [Candidatus Binatia bacterium]
MLLPLLMAVLLSGCSSPNYPTLKQTQIHVSWPMTGYRNASYAGRLTLGEKERVNAAYAEYQGAFDKALQAAHGNYDAPTPDNVKVLAYEVIRVISAIPY